MFRTNWSRFRQSRQNFAVQSNATVETNKSRKQVQSQIWSRSILSKEQIQTLVKSIENSIVVRQNSWSKEWALTAWLAKPKQIWESQNLGKDSPDTPKKILTSSCDEQNNFVSSQRAYEKARLRRILAKSMAQERLNLKPRRPQVSLNSSLLVKQTWERSGIRNRVHDYLHETKIWSMRAQSVDIDSLKGIEADPECTWKPMIHPKIQIEV